MTFFRSSIRLAVAMATSAIFAISIGCGPDAAAPLGCKDPARIPPPDDTVPYSEACCTSDECAQLGKSKGVCADFGDGGRLCTHACASNADCKGLGPEKCTSGKVCESSAAAPPSTSESN
jgi:hypothetical protein